MQKRSFLMFTGANDRAVFALCRAFEACGEPFQIVARNGDDRILRSRYRDRVCLVRDNDSIDLSVVESAVANARRRRPDDAFVVVPNSEYLNVAMLRLDRVDLRDRLGCELPLADREDYLELSNKASSSRYFASRGIRVPAELSRSNAVCPPVVAKPTANVVGSEVRYPLLLETAADLDTFERRPDRDDYFIQQYVRGRSEYLLAYLSRSGRAYLGSQSNLAQQPRGKSIVLARTSSFHEHPVAATAVDALLARGFHGLAMLEFIVDNEGPCFIELNPRPWGPLQLCLDHRCGIVEAFIGDALHGDPDRHAHRWSRRVDSARYLWLGGILSTWREGQGAIRWDASVRSTLLAVASGLGSDVYLRRDSWKVFLKELSGT